MTSMESPAPADEPREPIATGVLERFRINVSNTNIRFAIAASGWAGSLLREIPARNALPEPFDVIDHIGNLNVSTIGGYMGGLIVGQAYASRQTSDSEKGLRRRTRAVMAAAGALAGAAINAVAETRLGMSITHIGTTSDIIDYTYGLISATACGALLPKLTTERTGYAGRVD